MKGIVLLSHGPLAKGMYETSKWFMGESIDQYEYLCLGPSEQPEEFDVRIKEKIKKVDTGEGVILIADLKAGTPCNRCIPFANENITVLTGMNLSLVLELLGRRLSDDYNFTELVSVSQEGICNINDLLTSLDDVDDISLE